MTSAVPPGPVPARDVGTVADNVSGQVASGKSTKSTPGRGGSSPRRKGDAFEVRVVKDQRSRGRSAYRVRQGQGAIVDVLAVEHCQDGPCSLYGERVAHVFLIQARASGRLSAAEREQLQAEAERGDGIPLLAWPENGTVRYEQLGVKQS